MPGITSTGFDVPTWQAIYDAFAERWLAATGVELRDNKPEGQFFKAIAEQLSNRGFDDSVVDAIWPELHDIFYSGFITTATGIALDYLVKLVLRDGRRPATKARGSVWVKGEPATTIEAGRLFLTATNGAEFVNSRAFTINSAGIAYVPIVAVEAGPEGNVAAGTITKRADMTDVEDAGNTLATMTQKLAYSVNSYFSVPDDELTSRFQVFSVSGYDILDKVTIKAHNDQETAQIFSMALFFYSHPGNVLIGRTPLARGVIPPNSGQDISFESLNLDLYGHAQVRCVPVVFAGSGAVRLGFSTSGSNWYENNMPQNRVLYMELVFSAGGSTRDGNVAESDLLLRQRHLEALYTAGWGTPEAIRSQIMQLPNVMFARVELNPQKTPQTVRGLELPPAGIGVVVWGGDPDEIAAVLHQYVPFGTEMAGNVTRSVKGINGQLFTVKFYRPQAVPARGIITIFPSERFPIDGIARVKDVLISYIGGIDSKLQEHGGSGPGDILFHSRALALIHEKVPGIWGIDLKWGLGNSPIAEDDLTPLALEKPFATQDSFQILLRGAPL